MTQDTTSAIAEQADAPSRTEIADFYDEFNKRLVKDFVHGNPRFEAAVARVLSAIRPDTTSLLDIGCGAGVSSMLVKRKHPKLDVVAADISPGNIEAATALFGDSGVRYQVSNLADNVVQGQFDMIIMVDMHEHVPRADWPAFHSTLSSLLSDRGSIVMTYPSEMHQAYLQEHNPEGLQVVDETITVPDLLDLAERVGGRLALCEYVDIWKESDYVHAIITKRPGHEKKPRPAKRPLVGSLYNAVTRRLRTQMRRRYLDKRMASAKQASAPPQTPA